MLRLYFADGETCDGKIVHVADPDDGDGFVFDLLSTNVPSKYAAFGAKVGVSAVWGNFVDLERFEVVGS